MKGLINHLKKHTCNHHIIVHKHLNFCLHLEKKSHLSNQLKDVAKHNTKCCYSKKKISLQSNHVNNITTYNMKYLLDTSLHHNEMLRHITSMFTISETKED